MATPFITTGKRVSKANRGALSEHPPSASIAREPAAARTTEALVFHAVVIEGEMTIHRTSRTPI
jgi:hypothetical protein